MTAFPNAAPWREPARPMPPLAAWAGPWSTCFAVESGADVTVFSLADGGCSPTAARRVHTGRTGRGLGEIPGAVPPRHHQGMFAMDVPRAGVPDQRRNVAFMQHAHLARRVLDIGKWLALGNTGPAPVTWRPRGGPRAARRCTGGYVPVTVGGTTYQIYYETPVQDATCCACTPPARTGGSSTG